MRGLMSMCGARLRRRRLRALQAPRGFPLRLLGRAAERDFVGGAPAALRIEQRQRLPRPLRAGPGLPRGSGHPHPYSSSRDSKLRIWWPAPPVRPVDAPAASHRRFSAVQIHSARPAPSTSTCTASPSRRSSVNRADIR